MRELGGVLSDIGKHDEAVSLLRQALEIRTSTIGPDAPGTVRAQGMLAIAMARAGDLAAALPLLRDAEARSIRIFGTEDPFTAWLRTSLQRFLESAPPA
jgi:hypothetical protein